MVQQPHLPHLPAQPSGPVFLNGPAPLDRRERGDFKQYVDWVFDGDDIIAVSRTAFPETRGLPARQHDANFLTFHRISNFRNAGFETEHIGYDQL